MCSQAQLVRIWNYQHRLTCSTPPVRFCIYCQGAQCQTETSLEGAAATAVILVVVVVGVVDAVVTVAVVCD